MKFSNEAIDRTQEIMLIANTPAFLYYSLRAKDDIKREASLYTSADLLTLLNEILGAEAERISEVLLALTFLSFKNDYDPRMLLKLSGNKMEWFSEFVSYLVMESISVKEINIIPKIEISSPNYSILSLSASNYSSIDKTNDSRGVSTK